MHVWKIREVKAKVLRKFSQGPIAGRDESWYFSFLKNKKPVNPSDCRWWG